MRLEICGGVSCNCGVAVRVGDDVVVIDKCRRALQNPFGGNVVQTRRIHRHRLLQGGSFASGLKIYEHNNGRDFSVSR